MISVNSPQSGHGTSKIRWSLCLYNSQMGLGSLAGELPKINLRSSELPGQPDFPHWLAYSRQFRHKSAPLPSIASMPWGFLQQPAAKCPRKKFGCYGAFPGIKQIVQIWGINSDFERSWEASWVGNRKIWLHGLILILARRYPIAVVLRSEFGVQALTVDTMGTMAVSENDRFRTGSKNMSEIWKFAL